MTVPNIHDSVIGCCIGRVWWFLPFNDKCLIHIFTFESLVIFILSTYLTWWRRFLLWPSTQCWLLRSINSKKESLLNLGTISQETFRKCKHPVIILWLLLFKCGVWMMIIINLHVLPHQELCLVKSFSCRVIIWLVIIWTYGIIYCYRTQITQKKTLECRLICF